jgi:hypothetical protein
MLYVIYTNFFKKILCHRDATYGIDETDYGTDYRYLRSRIHKMVN